MMARVSYIVIVKGKEKKLLELARALKPAFVQASEHAFVLVSTICT